MEIRTGDKAQISFFEPKQKENNCLDRRKWRQATNSLYIQASKTRSTILFFDASRIVARIPFSKTAKGYRLHIFCRYSLCNSKGAHSKHTRLLEEYFINARTLSLKLTIKCN